MHEKQRADNAARPVCAGGNRSSRHASSGEALAAAVSPPGFKTSPADASEAPGKFPCFLVVGARGRVPARPTGTRDAFAAAPQLIDEQSRRHQLLGQRKSIKKTIAVSIPQLTAHM